jgi:acyl-CoA thioester hydrolase
MQGRHAAFRDSFESLTMTELGRYPVTLCLSVQWGEMDAFRHVNNVQFLRWFESARIAYFEALDIAVDLNGTGNLRPILARATIDYRAPLTYPDTVMVSATVKSFGTTSLVMGYRLESQAQQKLVAEGDAVVVLLDGAGAKMLLTDVVKARIIALERGSTADDV